MDPNATLRLARHLSSEIDRAINQHAETPLNEQDIHHLIDRASDLAILFDGLDEWLSKGGFLPDDWHR